MSAHSRLPSFSDSGATQAARVLYRCLETILTREFALRYETGLLVQCLSLQLVEDEVLDTSLLKLQVYCRGLTKMRAHLFVTCAGRMCEVLCNVEEGTSHRFSYVLPRRGEELPVALPTHDLATFLRQELENRLGRLLLQSPARPPQAPGDSLLP